VWNGVVAVWNDPSAVPTLAQPFVKQLTNAELELVPGAGHAMWIDVPDHAATITCRFFGH
jgi:pimeloyl-ACP methyl ester carboxylesterase